MLRFFHRLHLNPWVYTSRPIVAYSAGFLQCFSFLSVFVNPVSVCLLDLVMTLNDHSSDSVDPRFLNFHLLLELPDSAVFLEEEVRQAVVVDKHVRRNVDVLAHVIWIFRLFSSDSSVQLMMVVQLMVMRDQ